MKLYEAPNAERIDFAALQTIASEDQGQAPGGNDGYNYKDSEWDE